MYIKCPKWGPRTWGYVCMKNCISTPPNCHSHIHESTHFILFALLKLQMLSTTTSIINQYECHFSSKLHIYVYKVQSSCPQSLIPSTFLHSYIVLLVLVLSISINILINITINQSGGVKQVLCAHASPLSKMMQVFSRLIYSGLEQVEQYSYAKM
jgi:hypothetical protein